MRQALTEAIRCWEWRRLLYNAVLFGVVAVMFVLSPPQAKSHFDANLLLALIVLAVLANVAYCAAYLVDVPVQLSGFKEEWLRRRWVLLAIGCLFAGILAYFF